MARVSKSKKTSRPTSKKKSLKRNQHHPLFPALFFLIAVCSLIAALYLYTKYNNQSFRPHERPASKPDARANHPQNKTISRVPNPKQQSTSRVPQPTTLIYYRLELNFSQAQQLSKNFDKILSQLQKAHKIIHLLSVSSEGTLAPLPPNTKLIAARFTPPMITIDLSRDLTRGAINFGGRDEMLAISCLTNSFLLNFPGFESLQILIEGGVRETLAGHIDISQPLHYQPSIND